MKATNLIGLVILAAPALAAAQISDALDSRLDARMLRQDSRMELRDLKAVVDEAPPPIKWDLGVGAAYTDGEDGGETWSTPFFVKASFNKKRTALKLSGAGYSHVESQGRTLSGTSDLVTTLAHRLYPDALPKDNTPTPRWLGEIGLTLPTKGEVGSSKAKQRIGAAYLAPLGESWTGLVSAKLIRANADPPAGVSRVTRSGILQAGYELRSFQEVVFQLGRSYKPGSRGTSQAAVTYTLPLTADKKNGPKGSLGVTRGLTSGATDNTVEFDYSWSF